jgi:hypothetical protein
MSAKMRAILADFSGRSGEDVNTLILAALVRAYL